MSDSGYNPWESFFSKSLLRYKDNDLYRSLKIVDCQQSKTIRINGRDYVNFSSNDYLGLANSVLLKTKSMEILNTWGTGSGASPLISGHSRLYRQLEESLASFKGTEAGLVFPSGYAANIGVISQLVGPEDLILSDALNHASIVDGCRLARAKTVIYPHCDLDFLKNALSKYQGHGKTLVVTDTIFSMDGDLALLDEIFSLCRFYGALLYVDDAHGTGVLGENGKGSIDLFDLPGNEVVQIGTFSKALGSMGGFVAGSKLLIDYLINNARSFIYSTALPPAILAANQEALNCVRSDDGRRERLARLGSLLRQKLKGLGLNIGGHVPHIQTVIVGSTKETKLISDYLWQKRIYIPPIRPPTVPKDKSRLRISLSSEHDLEDLEALVEAFESWGGFGG